MAFQAALAREVVYRGMFVNEGACNVRMAANTTGLGSPKALVLIPVGMHLVTVAADHPSFGDRMVEVVTELGGLFAMARSAEGGLVCFQESLCLRRGAVNRLPGTIVRFYALHLRL